MRASQEELIEPKITWGPLGALWVHKNCVKKQVGKELRGNSHEALFY